MELTEALGAIWLTYSVMGVAIIFSESSFRLELLLVFLIYTLLQTIFLLTTYRTETLRSYKFFDTRNTELIDDYYDLKKEMRKRKLL